MNSAREQQAFTILEMMIVTTILSVLIMITISAIRASHDVFQTGTAVVDGNADARRALDEMAFRLWSSGTSTLSPPNPQNSPVLRFQENVGFAGGAITWSQPLQIEFVSDANEIPGDDVDNDGDGLVDEGYIRIWRDNDPPSMAFGDVEDWEEGIPARNVKEGGLSFTLDGTSVHIAVTVQKLDSKGRVIDCTCDTTITLRN